MRRGNSFFVLLCALVFASSCDRPTRSLKILGNIEEPQNEIANILANVLNQCLEDSVTVVPGIGSLANLDSLENNSADLAIVDNFSRFSDGVRAIMPLYPQVLHILHRRNINPRSLRELFASGKIFAGVDGSGTRRFVDQLIENLGIDPEKCEFVKLENFFDADVIFSFTDLLSLDELRDLNDYKLFSLDDVNNLGKGSLAEGICARLPQFEPYVIANDLYGNFATQPVLTLKVDAVLVCKTDIDAGTIYNIMDIIFEHQQDLKGINPLMFNVSGDFSQEKLNFIMHPGVKDFLNRNEPSAFEKHADLLSVTISVFVALASGLYSITRWKRVKKKNKIDKYYGQLINFRKDVALANSQTQLDSLHAALSALQEETINLVVDEKLLADESFSIFLNLSKIIMEEIRQKSNVHINNVTI